MIERRPFLALMAAGVVSGGQASAVAATQAATRIAARARVELAPATLVACEAVAHGRGWHDALPDPEALARDIAGDFRADRVVHLGGVAMSQTEIAWCLACGAPA